MPNSVASFGINGVADDPQELAPELVSHEFLDVHE